MPSERAEMLTLAGQRLASLIILNELAVTQMMTRLRLALNVKAGINQACRARRIA
jgi:hypothetical protein